jgi:drug/metabolite transporter (DMT)-like permease
MMENNLIKGIVIMMMCSLLASLSAAGTKYATTYLSLNVIVFVQYSIGLLFSGPALIKHGVRGFATNRLPMHLVRGLSGVGAVYCFYFVLTKIHLAEAILLRNSAPLWVPIIIRVWLGIKFPSRRWIPLIIGFVGVMCILRPMPDTISLWHLAGVSSAIFIAMTMISTRLLIYTETTAVVLLYYYGLAVPITLPLAIKSWQPAPWSAWGVLCATGVLLYLAMNLYTIAFRYAKPSVISPIAFFGVVFAGVWGWLFWDQVPVIWTYIGMFLVVMGTAVILIQGSPEMETLPDAVNQVSGTEKI